MRLILLISNGHIGQQSFLLGLQNCKSYSSLKQLIIQVILAEHYAQAELSKSLKGYFPYNQRSRK